MPIDPILRWENEGGAVLRSPAGSDWQRSERETHQLGQAGARVVVPPPLDRRDDELDRSRDDET
jgi:hypothetical protein